MLADYEKQKIEWEFIRRESRLTLILSQVLLATIALYALAAFLLSGDGSAGRTVQDAWNALNIAAVLLVIAVLAVRKTIYFSPRLVRDDFTLEALLRRWRAIDIVLLALSEAIALFGLVLALLGMPFQRTFHFFVAGFLLALINMPVAFKVRDKIRLFEKYAGKSIL